MKKISVGEIIKYLYYLEQELYGRRVSQQALEDGNTLHRRLGFFQEQYHFQRFIEFENELYLIAGMPDRIEGDYIAELKTYRNPNKVDFLREVVRTQANIYCWLSGLKRYKVYLYNVNLAKFTNIIEGIADYDKAERDIRTALKIKKEILEIVKKKP